MITGEDLSPIVLNPHERVRIREITMWWVYKHSRLTSDRRRMLFHVALTRNWATLISPNLRFSRPLRSQLTWIPTNPRHRSSLPLGGVSHHPSPPHHHHPKHLPFPTQHKDKVARQHLFPSIFWHPSRSEGELLLGHRAIQWQRTMRTLSGPELVDY